MTSEIAKLKEWVDGCDNIVPPVHCVLFEDFLLIYNAVAVALLFVVLG